MRFHLGICSKVKSLFIPSPVTKQPLNGEDPDSGLDCKSKLEDFGFDPKSPDFACSKEQIFFDSRPWLDSDCEDDFYSVNGEFTPSRGSTPNYQTSMPVTPSLHKAFFVDKFPDFKSEVSPTGRKKLADLLQESLQGEQAGNGQSATDVKVGINRNPDVYNIKSGPPPKSLDGTPDMSGADSVCGSKVTPNRDSNKKEKIGKAMHCCLPSLAHSFSFNEKRQKMSPGRCSS